MADITMCVNDACPFKDNCYRQTATPHPTRQSYASFKYTVDFGVVDCDHYIDEHTKKGNL